MDKKRNARSSLGRVGDGVYGTTYENFGYDGLGRITSAQNDDSTIAMSYDSFSNILTETQNNKTVTSVYDVLSFRTKVTYPGSKEVNLVPDDLNRITNVQDASYNNIAQYSYAGPGRVTGRSYLNGTSLGITYDDGRRAITYTHGATIGGFGYSFDKMNNKLYENRTFNSKGEAFKYDEIYRLTGVKYEVTNLNPSTDYEDYTGNPEENYTLDGVGNRTQVANGVITTTYSANALNQYGTISGTTLTYDLNGNLKWDSVITCTYNYANQLIKVIRSSDEQILGEYKYDVLGRRIYKKAWNGTTFVETYFYYDGIRCVEERNTSDAVLKTYVFGNGIDEVLTVEQSGNIYYYHENSLGSMYAVSDNSGVVIERYRYTVYGSCTFLDPSGNPITESAIGNRLLFTGREYDVESGFYYYRARYYSSELGRFLQREIGGVAGDEINIGNVYTYVGNNPSNWFDPTGLITIGGKEVATLKDMGKKDKIQARIIEELEKIGGPYSKRIAEALKNNQIDINIETECPAGAYASTTGKTMHIYDGYTLEEAVLFIAHEAYHAISPGAPKNGRQLIEEELFAFIWGNKVYEEKLLKSHKLAADVRPKILADLKSAYLADFSALLEMIESKYESQAKILDKKEIIAIYNERIEGASRERKPFEYFQFLVGRLAEVQKDLAREEQIPSPSPKGDKQKLLEDFFTSTPSKKSSSGSGVLGGTRNYGLPR